MKTSLYRLFDADGGLLYIGVSYNPMKRFGQHRHSDKQIHEVARADFVWFDTRSEAETAEAMAIRKEQPPWNKALTGRRVPRGPRKPQAPERQFNRPWRCVAVGEGLYGPYDLHLTAGRSHLLPDILRGGDRAAFSADFDLQQDMIDALPRVHIHWVRDKVNKATGTPRRNVE